MKLLLIIVWLLVLAFPSLGQTPSAQPTPTQSATPEKTRNFGSSLEKYRNKERQNSQNKPSDDEPRADEIIRVKTDLVVTDVLVTDRSGKIVSELKKNDFIVTENGAPQKVEMFSLGENASVSRSIVLIIDCGFRQAPYIKSSIEAAKTLVDKLAEQDKMAIVTIDVKLLSDFTQDKVLLKKNWILYWKKGFDS